MLTMLILAVTNYKMLSKSHKSANANVITGQSLHYISQARILITFLYTFIVDISN